MTKFRALNGFEVRSLIKDGKVFIKRPVRKKSFDNIVLYDEENWAYEMRPDGEVTRIKHSIGETGDVFYVKEEWADDGSYRADFGEDKKWKKAMSMPNKMVRLKFEIVDVYPGEMGTIIAVIEKRPIECPSQVAGRMQ